VSFQSSYTPEVSGTEYCYTKRAERIPCSACRGNCVTTPAVVETTWSTEEYQYQYVPPDAAAPEPKLCSFHLKSVKRVTSPDSPPDKVDGSVDIWSADSVPQTPKRQEDWMRENGFNSKIRPDAYYLDGAVGLFFTDHELATRVSKAIARMGTLCGAATGQKAEPF
jgi:hypothetical protein